jgi:hypothetical protein
MMSESSQIERKPNPLCSKRTSLSGVSYAWKTFPRATWISWHKYF